MIKNGDGQSMKRNESFRKKITIVMLAVCIIPSVLITVFAAYNTYNALYNQLILVNKDGILWSQDRLQQYTDSLKNTIYSIESNKDFKDSVMRWGEDEEDYSDITVMQQTLLSCLDQNNQFASAELYLARDNSVIKVERAGATIQNGIKDNSIFKRSKDMQTNLYIKLVGDKLYAVHTINKFEDRNMVAGLEVGLRNSDLSSIMSKMISYKGEQVYLLNDENEVLLSQGTISSEQNKLIHLALTRISEEKSITGNLNLEHNIVFYTGTEDGKLSLIKMIPRSEIINATLPTIYAGLLVGLLCIIGSVILSIMLSAALSRPIIELTERVKGIKLESLNMQTGEDTGDEVSVLENHIALFVEHIRKLIHEEYETKLQAKMAQIKALQTQINPHFLYNTLQLMGSIALSKGVNEVYNIASALSDIMRYSMNFETDFVTIQEEITHLDNYFLIQKQRFYDKFSMEVVIDDKVKQCLIPKLLIQPIVENSFKHGFEKCTDKWHMVIMAYLNNDNKVHIVIKDNGAGMSEDKLNELRKHLSQNTMLQMNRSEHIGLLNVNARIKLYFSENDGIQIKSEINKGTEIDLVFDAQMKEDENGIPGCDYR